MYLMLPHKGDENLELFMVGLFGVLFAWISVGFWDRRGRRVGHAPRP